MSRGASRRRKVAAASVLTLVVSTLVVLAMKYDGAPIHDVDLNDGGVWVTNKSKGMMARLNSQIDELDLGVLTSPANDQVFQQGESVQGFDGAPASTDRKVHLVNTLTGKTDPVGVGTEFKVAVGDGVAALVDGKTGRAWIRTVDQLSDFTESTPSDLQVSRRGQVAVTLEGTALFLDRTSGKVHSWSLGPSGTAIKGKTWDFDRLLNDDVQLTAVGEKPVLAQAGKVLLPGEDDVEISGADDGQPVLQAVGPAADDVYAATDTGLWRVPLDGGDPEEVGDLDADGRPAPPLVRDDCVHAAWADADHDNYTRLCSDEDQFTGRAASIDSTAELVFRSNRDVVVLNDMASGNAWKIQLDGLALVRNWAAVDPRSESPQKSQTAQDEKDVRRNKPPEAVDDRFGARPESTVVLPVTLNDKDPDGDILTVTRPPASVHGVTFSVVGNGTQVQASVPKGVRGTVPFEYEISDGRPENRTSMGHVELTIQSGADGAPTLLPDQRNELVVARGHATSVNVLGGWIDPDGDPLTLTKATSKTGKVEFRPDGTVRFGAPESGPSRATVQFTVQGRAASAPGTLDVTIVDPAKAEPHAVPDRFAGTVGDPILLEPLKNDTDPLGGELTLPVVKPESPGVEVDTDSQRGTSIVRTEKAGTYYLSYQPAASNYRTSDSQLIRVDVAAPNDDNLPPVAALDMAVMRPDQPTLVDVLANDADPDDDVLVVQGVKVPLEYQNLVKASLLDKHFVRVETLAPLGKARPELTYLLSDGKGESVEGVVKLNPTGYAANRPPVAQDDIVQARAGTIVTVPVLANDDDPDGDRLSVSQDDLTIGGGRSVDAGDVPVVATGDEIRMLVPEGRTEFQVTYGVRDGGRLRDDARLVLQIHEDTAKGDQAPKPRPIEERAVVGETIRVPVDVFGADPEGDPVVFYGVETPPQHGRVGRTGSNWFEYEPFTDGESGGTDTFRIRVADPYGRVGVVPVRIGVAPRAVENQVPAALNDAVTVKPGRTLRYPVLENDTDPDGDRLSLDPEQLVTPPGVEAKIDGSSIVVKVPDAKRGKQSSAVAQYAATDHLGVDSVATLTVTGDREAPDYAPTTQDDVVKPADLRGKSAGDTVEVDVLANDGDLDGSRAELEIAAIRPRQSSVVDDKLAVKLAKESRVVPYRVTDATGQSSYGFVYVPGTAQMLPTLDTSRVPLTVQAGRKRRIEVDDIVVVRPHHSPSIARLDNVEGRPGDVPKVDAESFTYVAPADYHGPASVRVYVTDGKGLNDTSGKLTDITVPINVVPARNLAPEARTVSLVLLAGDDRPRTIDLSRLATDPNEGDRLSFDVAEGRQGLQARRHGKSLLSLSADKIAPSSTQELAITVTDSKGASTETFVAVQVIALPDEGESTAGQLPVPAPPMTLRDLKDAGGGVGETSTFRVEQAILSDPFPQKKKRITSHQVVSGAAQVRSQGTELTVVPRSKGAVVVVYRLSDGSGQPARDALGRVVVTAADVPDRPGRPSGTVSGPSAVAVSWTAPADNGQPIRKYHLSWTGGGSKTCTATTCTVTGLDPGKDYRFTVAAENSQGTGRPSPPSAPVTPNIAPAQMAAPRIQDFFRDRNQQLHLDWSAPRANGGSQVTRYEFQRIPRATGGEVDRSVSAGSRTAMVWGGLSNGTQYSFRVRARNKKGASPWSAPSASGTPFTRPGRMPIASLESTDNGGTNYKGYLDVRWSRVGPPQNGYDSVLGYQVAMMRDGAVKWVSNVDASRERRIFQVTNGHTWRAQVRSRNRAGWGPWSAGSAPKITYDLASAPQAITRVHECFDNTYCAGGVARYAAEIGFKVPAQNGGFPIVKFTYNTSAGTTGTYVPTVGAAFSLNHDVRKHAWFDSPRWPTSTGFRVRIHPWTRLPDGTLVEGITDVSGSVFHPWAKPKRPERRRKFTRSVTFGCAPNGRAVLPHIRKSKTTDGAHLDYGRDTTHGGCTWARVMWDNPPPAGRRKCAVIYNSNSVATGPDSYTWCTEYG